MKTYIFQQTDSPARGFNTRITVHRIKRNRPHFVGVSDHNTASWKGAESEAITIIHECDGIPYGTDRNGQTDTYSLRGELGPAHKYTDGGQYRDAVRVFGI